MTVHFPTPHNKGFRVLGLTLNPKPSTLTLFMAGGGLIPGVAVRGPAREENAGALLMVV